MTNFFFYNISKFNMLYKLKKNIFHYRNLNSINKNKNKKKKYYKINISYIYESTYCYK